MRAILALVLTTALVVPAAGQGRSPAEQFDEAAKVYYGGKTSIEDYLAGYRDTVLDGSEGLWLSVSPDLANGDVADLLAKACARMAARLERTSPHSFTLTRNPDGAAPVRYTYVAMGGSVFSVQVDPEQLFNWMFPGGEVPIGVRNNALYYASGIAAIYRPSPDVLVMHQNFSVPTIYVRCP
jgi:hypothetical protein